MFSLKVLRNLSPDALARFEREARMTGGIATKILKNFREQAGMGRKKQKRQKSGGDDDDDGGGMMQLHGRGADYRGKQKGNFANGMSLKPDVKKSKGKGFKSKSKHKRR